MNREERFIFALVDGTLETQGYRVTFAGTLDLNGGASSRVAHDSERKKRQNQRRELRRLNRLLQTLRGVYREAARSSLENVCVELGKERDAARKECETLRFELSKCLFGDGSEGVVNGSLEDLRTEKYWGRGPYDIRTTRVTGSVLDGYSVGSGGGGGGGGGSSPRIFGAVHGGVAGFKNEEGQMPPTSTLTLTKNATLTPDQEARFVAGTLAVYPNRWRLEVKMRDTPTRVLVYADGLLWMQGKS